MTFERRRFEGRIKNQEQEFPIEFDVWSEKDCRLQIEVQPMPPQVVFALKIMTKGELGSYEKLLTIEGSSSDGASFSPIRHISQVREEK